MGEFLCLRDLDEEGGSAAFRAGNTYEGYFDDEDDLRLEDEQGNEICLSADGWEDWFEEV